MMLIRAFFVGRDFFSSLLTCEQYHSPRTSDAHLRCGGAHGMLLICHDKWHSLIITVIRAIIMTPDTHGNINIILFF